MDLCNHTRGAFENLRIVFRPTNHTPNLIPEHSHFITMRVGGEWWLRECEVGSCHGTAVRCEGDAKLAAERCAIGGVVRDDNYRSFSRVPGF